MANFFASLISKTKDAVKLPVALLRADNSKVQAAAAAQQLKDQATNKAAQPFVFHAVDPERLVTSAQPRIERDLQTIGYSPAAARATALAPTAKAGSPNPLGNFFHDLAIKAPARAAASFALEGASGPLNANGLEFQPSTKVQRFILGDDPVQSIGLRSKKLIPIAENVLSSRHPSLGRFAPAAAFLGVGGGSLLDLPGGLPEKKLAEEFGEALVKKYGDDVARAVIVKGDRALAEKALANEGEQALKAAGIDAFAAARLERGKAAAAAGTKTLEDAAAFEQARIRHENAPARPPLPESLPEKLKTVLAPISAQDEPTKAAFETWTRKKLTAEELGTAEIPKFKIPNEEGLQVIKDYQAGRDTPYSLELRNAFDDLFAEANDRGVRVKYRENYLPQVYKETPDAVQGAMARYLEDQGVDRRLIDEYVQGITELPPETVSRLKLNPTFSKERAFPDYETAMRYGLTPKYTNPAQLVAHYRAELEKTLANREFLNTLTTEGKLLPAELAPSHWKAVELPFSPKGYFAEPQLASMLNGIFRDPNTLGFGDEVAHITAQVSKKMQDIALSAGIPKSTVNFFAIGQLVKSMTAGDFKAIMPFLRANFDTASIRYFEKNVPFLQKMANQGIDMGGRIGTYRNVYENLAGKKTLTELAGETWDTLFNETTFGSFMPQLYTQTFKDAYERALSQGLHAAEAETFAGDVTKQFFGLMEDVGRAKGTEDRLSAAFFAPKFREGVIRTLFNTFRSASTEITNPAFYKNRRLVGGMILTYGLYNVVNHELTGKWMWENEPGKEFALKIPRKNGDIVYLEFMPSFLAFARNLASGAIAAGKGDFKTAGQKFGSVFSMPVKLTAEIISNRDYFGRPIYDDYDSTPEKLKKIAIYAGLQVNHPFIREIGKQLTTDKPLYQSISEAMELPFKFSSEDKVAKAEFYDALDRHEKERAKARDKVVPVYEDVQLLLEHGDEAEARRIVDELSPEDYEIYKSLRAADKRRATTEGEIKMLATVKHVQALVDEGREAEAMQIVDDLTDEEYKWYQAAKKLQ